MLLINEVSRISGISVRTLHYYDEIGLLHPDEITEAGYRLYGDNALGILQQILFFRELEFPLKEISAIMKDPSFDRQAALESHKKLLLLKRDRINELISLTEKILKGDKNMSFKEFDMKTIEEAKEKYGKEAKERWGKTEAYKESEKKASSYGAKEWQDITNAANSIFSSFSALVGTDPASPEAQELAGKWRSHITDNYYNCTVEILSGLADMYVADARFTENIDAFGKGTAQFMHDALKIYCK